MGEFWNILSEILVFSPRTTVVSFEQSENAPTPVRLSFVRVRLSNLAPANA